MDEEDRRPLLLLVRRGVVAVRLERPSLDFTSLLSSIEPERLARIQFLFFKFSLAKVGNDLGFHRAGLHAALLAVLLNRCE